MGEDGKSTRACKLTRSLILSATTLGKSRQETMDHFLGRVTHLHLQAKKLRVIENLDICVALKVLYLYDNRIEEIENLDFAKALSYLYLENNRIRDLPVFTNTRLKKLYLDENEISFIRGLDNLNCLEVLSVSRQRLPKNEFLQFDAASIIAISNTLEVLDISGNNLSVLQPFTKLIKLKKLFCSDNNIENVAVIEDVVCLPDLYEVNFKRNPVCSLRKYRDYVIGAASDSLREFDDKAITLKNIEAIRGVQRLRKRVGLNDKSDSIVSSGNNASAVSHNEYEEHDLPQTVSEGLHNEDEEQSQTSQENIEGDADFQIAQF